jgi:hypothetical protein
MKYIYTWIWGLGNSGGIMMPFEEEEEEWEEEEDEDW